MQQDYPASRVGQLATSPFMCAGERDGPYSVCSYLTAIVSIQQLNRIAISPDKRFIAAAGNQSVKIYDLTQPPQPGGNTPPASR